MSLYINNRPFPLKKIAKYFLVLYDAQI